MSAELKLRFRCLQSKVKVTFRCRSFRFQRQVEDVWTWDLTTKAHRKHVTEQLLELKTGRLYFRTVRGGERSVCPDLARRGAIWLGRAPTGPALFVCTAGSNVASCSPGDSPGMWLNALIWPHQKRAQDSLLSPLSEPPPTTTKPSMLRFQLPGLTAPSPRAFTATRNGRKIFLKRQHDPCLWYNL